MGDNSKIEWTDATWNPTIGCTKVSAGCKLCYWMAEHDRRHAAWKAGRWPEAPRQYHQPSHVVQMMAERLDQPLHWRRPRRIFVNSLSDLFHEEIPDSYIDQVFAVMALCRRHTFQILTKRPERMRDYMNGAGIVDGIHGRSWRIRDAGHRMNVPIGEDVNFALPLPNVWLGVSVEDQRAADERIPVLIQTPAAVRFLSCEPLIGAVLLDNGGSSWLSCTRGGEDCCMTHTASAELMEEPTRHFHGIDWVICGGESDKDGKSARPMHPDWARSLRDQCAAAKVPFFFKQWGEWIARSQLLRNPAMTVAALMKDSRGAVMRRDGGVDSSLDEAFTSNDDDSAIHRMGKKAAGRLLDGREWNEMPAEAER